MTLWLRLAGFLENVHAFCSIFGYKLLVNQNWVGKIHQHVAEALEKGPAATDDDVISKYKNTCAKCDQITEYRNKGREIRHKTSGLLVGGFIYIFCTLLCLRNRVAEVWDPNPDDHFPIDSNWIKKHWELVDLSRIEAIGQWKTAIVGPDLNFRSLWMECFTDVCTAKCVAKCVISHISVSSGRHRVQKNENLKEKIFLFFGHCDYWGKKSNFLF